MNFKSIGVISLCLASTFAYAQQNEPFDQYKITTIKQGNGAQPKSAMSTVSVLYKGTFQDGKVFDQSDKPISFRLNGVIPCWTLGVQKMKVGETAKLECPSNLAYGARGVPGVIPPNYPLNFEITLLSVNN